VVVRILQRARPRTCHCKTEGGTPVELLLESLCRKRQLLTAYDGAVVGRVCKTCDESIVVEQRRICDDKTGQSG
jgi:hypothetical protein